MSANSSASTIDNNGATPRYDDEKTRDDIEKATRHMTHEEKHVALHALRFGYGPLAHIKTNNDSRLLPAFGGEMQPGLYKEVKNRKIANPAPLGLCAFALTTFMLSLFNIRARGVLENNIVTGLAYGYGGLVQLLAGMWEMAVGNTFGATALSSYGGFWISYGVITTPGGFGIVEALEAAGPQVWQTSFALLLFCFLIFNTILFVCTLKSTFAFCSMFFVVDLAFLTLGLAFYYPQDNGMPNRGLQFAGGIFGMLGAIGAWYNALAGLADESNSFFVIPVWHFPWSAQGKANRMMKEKYSA